jgi:hypothetical protein
MSNDYEIEDRRKFLISCGRFAAVTPPAMTLLLSTSLTSTAIARSNLQGNDGPGHSFFDNDRDPPKEKPHPRDAASKGDGNHASLGAGSGGGGGGGGSAGGASAANGSRGGGSGESRGGSRVGGGEDDKLKRGNKP